MKLNFIDKIPNNYTRLPILISGETSTGFNGNQFLSLTKEEEVNIYEIRYEHHCSPFKQAEIVDNIIVVGHEEHFYLFDIDKNIELIVLKLSGYFGHIYIDKELIYLADAVGLYCINKNGSVLWSNNELGVDGVIINDFGDVEIYGSGEWDPAGGWEDFVVDKFTGNKIDKQNIS